MLLLAILVPSLSFILRGKIIHGIVCIVLQVTILGWLPAAIWAVISLSNDRAEKRTDRIVRAMREKGR